MKTYATKKELLLNSISEVDVCRPVARRKSAGKNEHEQ